MRSLAPERSNSLFMDALQVLGNDDRLISFAPQYLAFSHLWLAFHAHQTGTATSSEIISTEARQALSILSSAFQSEIPSSPSLTVKISSPTSVVVVNRTEEVATTGKRKAVSRATVMKTPKMSRTAPGKLIHTSLCFFLQLLKLRMDDSHSDLSNGEK